MSQITLIMGRQRSGKSTLITMIADKLDYPSLIIDPGSAKIYREKGYKPIHPRDCNKHKEGVRRISNFLDEKKLLAQIFGWDEESGKNDKSKAFINGSLFLEDAGSYINGNMTEAAKKCIKQIKQYGINLFLSYHSFDEISLEVLRLSPQKAIFLKTADESPVFTQIKKTKRFENKEDAKIAYYKAQFYGLTPQQIYKKYQDDLPAIARDLRIAWSDGYKSAPLTLCKKFSKFANGRENPTEEQIRMARFQPFSVNLRE